MTDPYDASQRVWSLTRCKTWGRLRLSRVCGDVGWNGTQPASRDPLHWCAWQPTVSRGANPWRGVASYPPG